ncbi:SDR family oxidoreductase [Membranicola marinus]|uniref:SDR family oxidoreductase n=1 Tax=Membranihabitans marinus TaxID=1227546 RepID=A0A953L9Y0_9BACT|nr:SDR family NAD(P)-dependent oxidoreductase [Membranihabitans marinus]MBY5957086.1 SDR family oxidoreductase [Membranihabitans marinus]
MDIVDKIFVVTGAGSGLGHATTQGLCDAGAAVIALDLKFDPDTLDDWEKKKVVPLVCDVRESEEMIRAVQSGVSHFGHLHGAIACAGVAPAQKLHSSRSGSHSAEDFANTVAINLTGTFNLFNSCVPHLKENTMNPERGVLIATSSIAATEGQIGQVAYAASKGGVSAMILPLARELARSGIRVNAIAPGIFGTPMVAGFPEKVQDSLAASVPFPKRLGNPTEFARLVKHIIENEYINGTVVRLDGSVRMG